MPRLALLTAHGGTIELAEFPFERLMPEPFHLADVNAAFASAGAGLVPRGALIP
ncbi:hypothetical protein [Mycobacterium sp.]|uniref:hypothetical protein n=1 Tax=Mycobacterium sp. TaxID=1785 RepID=UPI002609A0A7|nr:hypothetical protein [Mycobacterium sp.]